jgi:hypothetical protein
MKRFENRCNRSLSYKKALLKAKNKYLNQNTKHASSLQVAMMTNQRNSLIPNYIWAFDTASDTHICNDLSRFNEFQPYESIVHIGDTTTKIKGFGKVNISPTNSGNMETIFKLNNTAYIPEFYINLISASKAKAAGIYYNAQTNCLEQLNGQPACYLKDQHGISLVKWDTNDQNDQNDQTINNAQDLHEIEERMSLMSIKKSEKPSKSRGSEYLWHQRLGHPDEEVINHLEDAIQGIKVIKLQENEFKGCEIYNISNSQRQISRIPINIGDQPFETIY